MDDQPHIPSVECPCHPHVLAYGEEPVYGEAGEVIGYTTADESE